MKTIRFSTLLNTHGIPRYLEGCLAGRAAVRRELTKAHQSNRLLVVVELSNGLMYGEVSRPNPWLVWPIGYCVFNKPLPAGLHRVIGVKSQLPKLRQLMALLA